VRKQAAFRGSWEREGGGRKRGDRYRQSLGSTDPFISSGLRWRRGWDSKPACPFRICKLQKPRCHGCPGCRRCRGALHLVAPTVFSCPEPIRIGRASGGIRPRCWAPRDRPPVLSGSRPTLRVRRHRPPESQRARGHQDRLGGRGPAARREARPAVMRLESAHDEPAARTSPTDRRAVFVGGDGQRTEGRRIQLEAVGRRQQRRGAVRQRDTRVRLEHVPGDEATGGDHRCLGDGREQEAGSEGYGVTPGSRRT